MLADFLGAGDTLSQAYAKRDAQLMSNRLCLGHHRRRKLTGRRISANVQERRTRERADGIEGQIAPELEPDLGANIVEDWSLESRLSEALRNLGNAYAARPVELSDRESISFDVFHHARRDQLGGWIHDTADHPLGRNLPADDAGRIDAAHSAAGQFASMLVEVPVGDAVLHRHHG